MKKKKLITLIIGVVIVIIISAIILLVRYNLKYNKKIEIIDASYMCAESLEKFYEDEEYTYYFTCVKSGSVFVKLPNGNKVLVVRALEENQVTIDELIKAGLEVYKVKK